MKLDGKPPMDTQPTNQPLNKKEIHFPNGNRAQVVIPPVGTRAPDLLRTLGIQQPKAVIIIAGGAANLNEQLDARLIQLFSYGIAPAAASVDAMIIDGGTHSGVMAMMGQGVAAQDQKSTLLGVSPAGSVTYPGKPGDTSSSESTPLDPNHSHFVLVETNEWGGETETMYALAAELSVACPSVAMLVNGGSITKDEVLHNVRQRRPIIVIEGSGRLADEVAKLWREKPSSIPDPKMAEIIARGDIHLFPLSGSATKLVQLTLHLLEAP